MGRINQRAVALPRLQDHSLLLQAMILRGAKVSVTCGTGVVDVAGVRYSVPLDELGVPKLDDTLRGALRRS
jgi:hypothetical protein